MSEPLTLTVKLGPGKHEMKFTFPGDALPWMLQSLASASVRQRRVLVKGFLAAHAGDARQSWVWLGAPAKRWDDLSVESQDEIGQQILEAIQTTLRERKPLVREPR